MIQRVLASKGLVAYVLACATGITLYFRRPFPENDLMLHLISIRAPLIYAFFKYTYTLFLFTECAINPELLETRIQEAEHRLTGCHYLVLADADFRAHPEYERFHFVVHEPGKSHKAPQSPALEEALKQAQRQYQLSFEPPSQPTDP